MIITYHGKQFFKLQQGDSTYAYNPLSKDNTLGIKPPRFGADVTLVSVRHPFYNGVDNTSFGDTQPFVVQGPGSYEIKGVTVNGFATPCLIEDIPFINTLYFVMIDTVSYCFIGDLENPQLDQHIKEFTDAVDVLFVPIGGNGTLNASAASKISKIFSPKIIIPMDYGKDRDKESLDIFLKEMGSHSSFEEKYVFKKSDIESLSSEVILIKEQ